MSTRVTAIPDAYASAWRTRRTHFDDIIAFHAPSIKEYETSEFSGQAGAFVSLSVTGSQCSLQCDHCNGAVLDGMAPATDPETLVTRVRELAERGAEGVLISGGCNPRGQVDLEPYLDGIAVAADNGLEVALHTGLIHDPDTAQAYADAGASAAMVDIIGATDTIESVYHLSETTPNAYKQTLEHLDAAGLTLIPHVVAGLHYGEIRGEYDAIEMIADVGVDTLVFVVVMPVAGAPMADVEPPDPAAVGDLFRTARERLPETTIMLGCARPRTADYSVAIERRAIQAGVNGIAFPSEGIIDYATDLGLEPTRHHTCCSL